MNLNPDWTFIEEERRIEIKNANIESITLSCSNLYVKSNGFYYEQSLNNFNDKYQANDYHELNFDIDFTKNSTLKNIIKSGIYDILIFDEHVKIFSNINPLK